MRHTRIVQSMVVALAFSALATAATFAQDLSRQEVARGCAVQNCSQLVNQFIGQLQASNMSAAEVDNELAALSNAMAAAAQTASDAAQARIADALQTIAAAISDPAVSQQVAALAGAVAAGSPIGNLPASGA